MSKLMYEIEVSVGGDDPTYIYIKIDDDLDINFGTRVSNFSPDQNAVTHITVINTDIGMEPDLIISRRIEE